MKSGKAFIEDYKGIVGFEAIPVDDPGQLVDYTNKETDIFYSIKNVASRLDELGWTPSNAGNISIRESPHHTRFFITASGSDFSDLKEKDVVGVQEVYVVVGKIPLYIGANYGIKGEFLPSRIVEALAEQDLLENLEKDLGIDDFDYRFPSEIKTEMDLFREGKRLIRELNLGEKCRQNPYVDGFIKETGESMLDPINPEALLTEEYLRVLARDHNLTENQVQALRLVRNCENVTLYDMLCDGINEQNDRIIDAGLGPKALVRYLGERGLLSCRVYYTGFGEPSSETPLHGTMYARRWEDNIINAIVHCHAPQIVSNPPKGMPITDTHQKEIGYGSLELAVEAINALKDGRCVLLKGHGPVAVSDSWQRWVPTERKGVYRLDESFEPVFEDAFRVLKKSDEWAGRNKLINIFEKLRKSYK